MSFVHPYFLIALAAIAIPIIIHLFNFRRFKKIHFTNVKFIEQVRKRTRKKSQLKHLIVLMLRILAVSSLVFAFAQPYIPLQDQLKGASQQSVVSIYLDNSFSMQARTGAGTLLDEAKKTAEEIAGAYSQSDLFHLLTNDFERRHQRLLSRDDFIEAVNQVTFSPEVRRTDEVLARQTDFLVESQIEDRQSFIISDFQASITVFSEDQADTGIYVHLIPVMAEKSANIYIDSCWFVNPVHQIHQSSKLMVRIRNSSGILYEKIPLKLTVNQKQKALASFDIGPGESADLSIQFSHHEAGVKKAVLEIDDYPVVYDDKFYFSYEVRERIPVLSIYDNEENPYLHSFYSNDSAFLYSGQPERNLNYSELQSYNLIVIDHLSAISSGLSQELFRFVNNGGSLLLIPAAEMDAVSYESFTDKFDACSFGAPDSVVTRVTGLNLNHQLFSDVFEKWPDDARNQFRSIDLPVVSWHYPLQYPALTRTEQLMPMGNERDFLNVLPVGKGKLYLMASPLDPDFNSLPRHAILVPLLYRMAVLSQPYYPLFYTIGRFDDQIWLPGSASARSQVLKVREDQTGNEFIPERRDIDQRIELIMHGQVRNAGHYTVAGDGQVEKDLAFNFDRRESDLSLMGEDKIEDLLSIMGIDNISIFSSQGKPVTRAIQEMNEGIKLWKLFIILALIFLAAETIMLRIWK